MMSVRSLAAMAMTIVIASLCIAPSALAAEAPTGLQVTAGVGHVDLNWQTAPGADAYCVYRGDGGTMMPVANVTAPITSYHDTDVDQETNYFYYVTAWENGTQSAVSNSVSVTVPAEEEESIVLPVLAIVLSVIAIQVCIVMLLYFSKQKMQLK